MNSNYRTNKKAIDQFRKELKAMLGDIGEVDKKVLNRAVNAGVRVAKENTPVITGFMRRRWGTYPARKTSDGITKRMFNAAGYSEYVNYGHRTVDGEGNTTGWVEGKFILEKAVTHAEKVMKREFEKEINRINREHNK